jgi:glucokinase
MTPLKLPSIRSAKPKITALPAAAVALSVDALDCRAALVDERGRVISERSQTHSRTALHRLAADLTSLIIDTAAAAEPVELDVRAVGLSINGYISSDNRVTMPKRSMSRAGSLKFNNAALREAVETELSSRNAKARSMRLAITSRVAASVVAESWIGAASGESDVVFLSIADDIEAGLLVDGRVVRGSTGRAGAAGWFALSEVFHEEFAESGCLNVESARQAVVRRTLESWHDQGGSLMSQLSVSHPSEITAEMVIRAARGGDTVATRVIADLTSWIGRGIAEMVSMLNPRVVVVGGTLGVGLRPFLGDLRKETRRWAEPAAARQCRIVTSSLGEKGVLIGAARLALNAGTTE